MWTLTSQLQQLHWCHGWTWTKVLRMADKRHGVTAREHWRIRGYRYATRQRFYIGFVITSAQRAWRRKKPLWGSGSMNWDFIAWRISHDRFYYRAGSRQCLSQQLEDWRKGLSVILQHFHTSLLDWKSTIENACLDLENILPELTGVVKVKLHETLRLLTRRSLQH